MKSTPFVLAVGAFITALPLSVLGQTEVPNTFVAGQPARAAEVNGNFGVLVSATNQNTSEISANTSNISSNTSSISTNTTSIGGNAQSIVSMSQSVTANSQGIETVSQAVADLTPPPGFQFAGFSTNTVNGGVGLFAMNAACQSDFGANSRMATSVEILYTTVQASMIAPTAWIKPVVVSVTPYGTDNLRFSLFEASGIVSINGSALSCAGWSTSGGGTAEGLAINASGGFIEQGCGTQSAVACSVVQ